MKLSSVSGLLSFVSRALANEIRIWCVYASWLTFSSKSNLLSLEAKDGGPRRTLSATIILRLRRVSGVLRRANPDSSDAAFADLSAHQSASCAISPFLPAGSAIFPEALAESSFAVHPVAGPDTLCKRSAPSGSSRIQRLPGCLIPSQRTRSARPERDGAAKGRLFACHTASPENRHTSILDEIRILEEFPRMSSVALLFECHDDPRLLRDKDFPCIGQSSFS